MSEIPFVNLLGDELERAAERAQPRVQRSWQRRRLGLFAVAGALLVSGTAIATGILSGDVEQQAASPVTCYDRGDSTLKRSVAVLSPRAGSTNVSPVELCQQLLKSPTGQPVGPLVACGTPDHVAVIPGRDPSACVAAGFARLDPRFAAARTRTAAFERRLLAVEAAEDCIAPTDLAQRVQQLLESSGWVGWTTRVLPNSRANTGGPCGTISSLGGDGQRYLAGSGLDGDHREVLVSHSAGRRITDLLYAADNSLLGPLIAESGATCFSYDELTRRARRVFSAENVSVTFHRTTLPAGVTLDDQDGRATRYRQGCAVLSGGQPGPNPDSAVLDIIQKP